MRTIVSAFVLAAAICMGSVLCGQSQRTLSGVILDMSGAIIPGATIRLFSPSQLYEMKSDSNGQFRFAGLDSGTYELEASSLGFITATIDNVHIPATKTEPLRLILQVWFSSPPADCGKEPPASYEVPRRKKEVGLSGVVRDANWLPIPQAQLNVSRFAKTQVVATQRANDKGEFEFPNLEPGKYTLSGELTSYSMLPPSTLPPSGFWITRVSLTTVTLVMLKPGQVIICE
jgi:hypothetical protein